MIIFPDVVSFPLKQRLAIHGAVVDKTLPAPQISDEADHWQLSEDTSLLEDIPYVDGSWGENAAKFDKSVPLAEVLAMEPDVENEDDPVAKDDQSDAYHD